MSKYVAPGVYIKQDPFDGMVKYTNVWRSHSVRLKLSNDCVGDSKKMEFHMMVIESQLAHNGATNVRMSPATDDVAIDVTFDYQSAEPLDASTWGLFE